MPADFNAVMDKVDESEAVVETPDAVEAPAAVEPAAVEVAPKADADGKVDWRKVPTELREFFKTPAGTQAKDAWMARAAWNEKFPGGTKEADEILGWLNEQGGREAVVSTIGELTTKAQDLDALNDRIASGDASLISDLPPEAITALAPSVLTEWAKNDFDGYNAQLSGIFAQTIAQAGIPLDLERADMQIEFLRDALIASGQQDNPAIVRAFKALEAQFGKFKDFAGSYGKTVPQQSKTNPTLDAREQAIAQRESAQRAEQFDRQIETFKAPAIDKELKSFFDRDSDAEKQEAARQMVRIRVNEALTQEQREKGKSSTAEQVKALVQRGKLEDASRIAKSRETLLIQQIAPKVGRIIYGQPAVKTDPVAKPVVQQVTRQPVPRGRVNSFNSIFDE